MKIMKWRNIYQIFSMRGVARGGRAARHASSSTLEALGE